MSENESPASGSKCTATTKKGTPCRSTATAKSGYLHCPFHGSAYSEEERQAWRQRGGLLARPTVPARTPGQVNLGDANSILRELEAIVANVETGALAPRTAIPMISAIRAAHDVLALAVVAKRLKILEERQGLR